MKGRTGPMDESALRRQLEEHHAASFGWALNCCKQDAVEAEDVLQTAYLNVLEGRARYGGQAAFRTWLFAVIRRTAADVRRRRWMQRLGLARYEQVRRDGGAPEQPPDAIEQSERQAAFLRLLGRLPRRQREALHLVFYQDLTLEESAGAMGVSVGSARQHYARGKQRMGEWLSRSEDRHE